VTSVFLYIRTDCVGRRFSQGSHQGASGTKNDPAGALRPGESCSFEAARAQSRAPQFVIDRWLHAVRPVSEPGIITIAISLVQSKIRVDVLMKLEPARLPVIALPGRHPSTTRKRPAPPSTAAAVPRTGLSAAPSPRYGLRRVSLGPFEVLPQLAPM